MTNLADWMMYDIETNGSTDTWCGECIKEALKETASGRFTGDEAFLEEFIVGPADMNEPIQCGSCNKQNDAYEEIE